MDKYLFDHLTTRFNFSFISAAFGKGNVPALAVQRLEVAATILLRIENNSQPFPNTNLVMWLALLLY